MILMMNIMTQVMSILIQRMMVKQTLMMVFWMQYLMNYQELAKQDLLNLRDLLLQDQADLHQVARPVPPSPSLKVAGSTTASWAGVTPTVRCPPCP